MRSTKYDGLYGNYTVYFFMKRIASSSNADTIVLRAIYEVEKVERTTRQHCFSASHALS